MKDNGLLQNYFEIRNLANFEVVLNNNSPSVPDRHIFGNKSNGGTE